MDFALLLALCSAALFSACLGILVLWFIPRFEPTEASIFIGDQSGAVFIFDGEEMIDSTPEARLLLANSPIDGADWSKLLAFLVQRFDALEENLASLAATGGFALAAKDPASSLLLKAEHRGGLVQINLIDSNQQIGQLDPLINRAMAEELSQLRDTVATAPLLIWRESSNGDIVWGNGPYLKRACLVLEDGKDLRWPLPKLFQSANSAALEGEHRQALEARNKEVAWFSITTKPEKDGYLRFAASADALVQAETALREFMQTLTKTFAQLPIGLAVFDRDRKLQLFNPALTDLTHLPVDFLSRRPTLLAVLDTLREQKMLPEPKNYSNWRRQVAEMERAAASGYFEETWNLPDGQTYKVVGRPHPNGALALMIEDISNEMRRTRRYRADLELGQAVVDQMPDAIAVFSQSGQLVMSNAGYSALWHHRPGENLGDNGAKAITGHWRDHSAETKLWTEAEEYIDTVGDRESWEAQARLMDGRIVNCLFSPLSGGATLVVFRPEIAPVSKPKPRIAAPGNRRRA